MSAARRTRDRVDVILSWVEFLAYVSVGVAIVDMIFEVSGP